MEKKRIPELDIIKGIGILNIMAVHLIYRIKDSMVDRFTLGMGWLFIVLFFMLSGYGYTYGRRTVSEWYRHRLHQLLLPAVIMEAVLLVVGGAYCMLMHGYTLTDVWHDVLVTVLRPQICEKINPAWGGGGLLYENLSPSWFIWTMAWVDLLFYPIAKWCEGGRKTGRWLAALIVLIGIQIPLYMYVEILPWLLELVPLFTAVTLIGMKVRDMKLTDREWKINMPLTALIAVACIGIVFAMYLFDGNECYFWGIVGNFGNWVDVVLTVTVLVPGTIGFFALAKLLMKLKWFSRGLVWVGQHTFVFLLCHDFFGMIAADILQTYIKPGSVWYLEYIGLTLTPEIFFKSLAGLLFSAACCSVVCLAKDRFREKLRARSASQ